MASSKMRDDVHLTLTPHPLHPPSRGCSRMVDAAHEFQKWSIDYQVPTSEIKLLNRYFYKISEFAVCDYSIETLQIINLRKLLVI